MTYRRSDYLKAVKHNLEPNIFFHSLALEACMGGLYDFFSQQKQLKESDLTKEEWTLAGLIHDIDYAGENKPFHPTRISEVLKGYKLELPDKIAAVINAHAPDLTGFLPVNKAEWSIYCADSLTGLIIAVTLVYPSKKLSEVKVASVLKRLLKQPSFASGTRRAEIMLCEKEEGLNMPLEKFVDICLTAMQKISVNIGL